ncbi:MAG: hypothetical protein GY697_24745 [Desulfobacterales bacterium]|nr:hypothetical protein [Desulfobacterales bacterium]
MTNELAEPLKITLDIAATVSAIIWPVVLIIVLYLLRERIPELLKELVGRVTKLDIAGVTLEFAKAKVFTPEFSSAAAGIDLRQHATAMQVNDSTAGTFFNQLRDPTDVDYAIVNLEAGDKWLTSRLYIMAVVFARMKNLKAFVFVDQSGTIKRYLGWVEPNRVRWALAKKYPWLEGAYAAAYADVVARTNATAAVISSTGRLGYQYNSDDPGPSIEIIKNFLQRSQWPQPPGVAPLTHPPVSEPMQNNATEWVLIDENSQTQEHTTWLTSTLLDEILGDELDFAHIGLNALQGKTRNEQIRLALVQDSNYVAVTHEELRFEYLIDRSALMEKVVQTIITE